MREEIKSRLEIIPLLLVFESIICFLLSFLNVYVKIYDRWESATECSLLMCFIFYSLSKDWQLLSKKCLITLVLLNLLNLYYGDEPADESYYFYFQSFIYSLGIFLIVNELWRKK